MRVLYLDCSSGISGDMFVGALCGLGVKPSAIEWELSKLPCAHEFHLHVSRTVQSGISAVQFTVHGGDVEKCGSAEAGHDHGHSHEHAHSHTHEHEHEEGHKCCGHDHSHDHKEHDCGHDHGHSHQHAHSHTHEHEHEEEHKCCGHDHSHDHKEHDCGHDHGDAHSHEHAHSHTHEHEHEEEHKCCGHDHEHDEAHGRSFADIREMLLQSELSDFVKKHAVSIFTRIAVAEGKIHGVPTDQVHFHEIGAIDSIVDIVAACVAVEALAVDEVRASVPNEGSGFIEIAHGRLAIPVPATLALLEGIPFEQTSEPHELITPTGAAILKEFATSFGPMSGLVVEKIGYGAGTRKLKTRINLLRAVLAEARPATAEGDTRETVVLLETNLDDVSAEIMADAQERLLAAGALDVFSQPAQMKKGRPGTLFSALVKVEDAARMAELIMTHTSSFGVRETTLKRHILRREIRSVETPFGRVDVKLGFLGAKQLQAAPEFDSCRRAAERASVPVRAVYEAAQRAASA